MIKLIRNFVFQTYFKFTRPMTLGARIIAVRDNKICLIKHTYIGGWHLPGGGVEKGENAYEAALKELREEAGIIGQIEDLKLISIHTNFQNFPSDHVILFAIENFEQSGKFNEREIAECAFFSIDELPQGTTRATIERINEYFGNVPQSRIW